MCHLCGYTKCYIYSKACSYNTHTMLKERIWLELIGDKVFSAIDHEANKISSTTNNNNPLKPFYQLQKNLDFCHYALWYLWYAYRKMNINLQINLPIPTALVYFFWDFLPMPQNLHVHQLARSSTGFQFNRNFYYHTVILCRSHEFAMQTDERRHLSFSHNCYCKVRKVTENHHFLYHLWPWLTVNMRTNSMYIRNLLCYILRYWLQVNVRTFDWFYVISVYCN